MGFFAWIALGAAVGFIARWVVPGEGPGFVGDVVAGVAGALVGGLLDGWFGRAGFGGVDLPSMVCALIGAVVLLWLIRVVRGRSSV
ncbi:MAG TPA: GlsB/YeaQ/YmgE family stress response membrane protein [Candidatus Cybelea sp.]|nr:GlsB/YeaQ/YmgE family stress response membrane protein [Candidatus Cybelea sp.]